MVAALQPLGRTVAGDRTPASSLRPSPERGPGAAPRAACDGPPRAPPEPAAPSPIVSAPGRPPLSPAASSALPSSSSGCAPRGCRPPPSVIATTSDFDGVVLSSTVSSGDGVNASFELSFPSDRAAQAVARLARLGRVRSQTSSSQDVTRGFLTAREELDAARAGLARIRNRTDFSKVSLQLSAYRGATTTPPANDGGWTPGDALHDAGRILAVSAGVALIVLACLVPLGAVLLLAGLGGRTLRRRRREAALA